MKAICSLAFIPDTNFDDEGGGKCVNMLSGELLGYWFVSTCNRGHGFICEYPRKGFTTPPPPTTTTPPPEAKYYLNLLTFQRL